MSQIAEFILVLVGSFSIILTLMAVFFFVLIAKYRQNLLKQQNQALNNLIIGQDVERERLARDIHDEMGPQLAGVIFCIDAIKSTGPEALEAVNEAKTELRKAIQDLRKISHDLMSQSLIKYGLVAAIEELIYRQPPDAIKIKLTTNSTGLEYGDEIKSHLFRITQELIFNSNKYSEAESIFINLLVDTETRALKFVFKDNGKGNPDYDPSKGGIGLKNISTRVGLMNGTLEVDMKKGFLAVIKLNY